MYPYRVSLLFVSLAAGIIFGHCTNGLGWVTAVLLGVCGSHLIWMLARKHAQIWAAFVPVLLVIGMIISPQGVPDYTGSGYSLSGLTLDGRIVARPCGAPGESRALLKLAGDVPEGPASGDTVYLRLNPEDEQPEWGWEVRASGDLFVYGAPAGNTSGSLSCRELEMVKGPANPFRRASNFLRRQVLSLCRTSLSPRSGGLLAGIILGDYRCLSEEDAASLKRSGLIHLCSASGLHVGILLLISLWLARRMKLGRNLALVMQMPLLLIYSMAAGMTPPIVRSALLAAAAAIAFFTAREFHVIPAMSFLALASLLAEPELLQSVSFQLTYAAAAACILLATPVGRALGFGGSKAARLFSTSLAAQAGIVPLLLYHFGEFSLMAPLSNLVVIPLIPAVMVLGLGGACVTFIPAATLRYLMWPLELLLRLILGIAELAASQAWAVIFNPGLPPGLLWSWYALLWPVFLRRPRRDPGKVRIAACCLLLLAALFLWRGTPLRAGPGGLQIDFLDVGQGDGILVRGAAGETVLIDGGPDGRILQEKLRGYGVRALDLVVLTHPHSDHMEALMDVARLWPIGTFVHNGEVGGGGLVQLLDILSRRNTVVRSARAGETLQLGDLHMSVLSPQALDSEEGNENSLVLRMEVQGVSLLLAGDIGEEQESELMESGVKLKSDMLKVPHHGGSSPANEKFFQAVQPALAFIQVGKDNSFGHPALSTLQYLRRAGCRVFRTDEHGDIVVSNPDGSLMVQTERRP